MKVLVSACLLGENCKYSGGNNLDPRVAEWLEREGHEAVPVCPEQLGGLPTVYDGTFSGRRVSGQGVFARLLAESGFPLLEPEDLP